MARKIETAAECADVIKSLSPEKMKLLIAGLRAQHPQCRNKSDAEIRKGLRNFIQDNGR